MELNKGTRRLLLCSMGSHTVIRQGGNVLAPLIQPSGFHEVPPRSYIVYASCDIVPSMSETSATVKSSDSPAEYWRNCVEQTNLKFQAFIGNSAPHYIDKLCIAFFTTNHDKNTIRNPLTMIANLHTRVRKYQEKILQLAGAGREWTRSKEITHSFSAVITSFKEVLCLAEGDQAELAMSRTEGIMWYQQHYK
jgi:hypothetical protein